MHYNRKVVRLHSSSRTILAEVKRFYDCFMSCVFCLCFVLCFDKSFLLSENIIYMFLCDGMFDLMIV